MSDMVERVADALARLPIRDLSNKGGELDKLRLREAARAAIEAMRKPTPHMLGSRALLASDPEDGRYLDDDVVAELWDELIDRALTPTPPER